MNFFLRQNSLKVSQTRNGERMTDTIDYGRLMHNAMRGLMADLLKDVAKTGLPGEHHFFITFDTQSEGVEMADWLRERYKEEMTVVMQHWFEDLEVGEDFFAVTLNFGNDPEHLRIPFDAISTFVDPSVEFGLKFESSETDAIIEDFSDFPELELDEDDSVPPKPKGDAEIVSLDSFRK